MRAALRHGLFYCLIYMGTGATMPYLPVWFKARGLSAAQIGIIIALPMLLRVLLGPILAVWADGFSLRRTPMIILALVASLAYAALLAFSGFLPWLVLYLIAATAIAAVSPLADVFTLRRTTRDGFSYSIARGIGSAGYVAANILCGLVVAVAGSLVAVIWSAIAALACAIGARVVLPKEQVLDGTAPANFRTRLSAHREFLGNTNVAILLLAVSLIQGSHALYYAFSAIAWRAQGASSGLVGAMWGVSVTAEVAFLWFGAGLRSRLGAVGMIVAGGAGAVIRWTALSLSAHFWLVFPLQALHALTFSATYIGSLMLIAQLTPRDHASSAQTLLASLSYGLATGLATLAGGALFQLLGARAYLGMSLMALLGVMAALILARRLATSLEPAHHPQI